MAERGRKAGFQMGAEHRTKIANSKILNRLIQHAEGEIEMTPTQVSAGLGLLDRVMPKLASVQHSGDEENPVIIGQIKRVIVPARSEHSDS